MNSKVKKWSGLSLLTTMMIVVIAQMGFAQTTIVFQTSLMGSKEEARNELIKDFEKAHPNIKIEHRGYHDIYKNHEKLLTSMVGGNPPDLVSNHDHFVPTYAYYNGLEPLDMYFELAGLDSKEIFYQVLLDACTYNGKLYGAPLFSTADALLYNRDIFKEEGLDPAKPPKNWDDLLDYAQRLTIRKDGKLIRAGVELPYGKEETRNRVFLTLLWSNGGKLFNEDLSRATFNTEEGIEALQFYVDLFNKYKVCEIGWGAEVKHGQEPFLIGKSAMEYAGAFELVFINNYAPELNFKPAVFPGRKKQTGPVVSFPIFMPKGTKHKAVAWKFIKFAISKEANTKFAKLCARLPSTKEAGTDSYFKENLPVFIKALEMGTLPPPTPGWKEITDLIQNAMDEALYGIQTSEQALDEAARKANEVLAQY